MVRLNELRIGNHVLCGSIAAYIPKAVREVGVVRFETIATRVTEQHPDIDEYTPSEIDGVEVIPAFLQSQGWQQSRLSANRYIYANEKERFVWDGATRHFHAQASELVERSGCVYLHQLENAIIDSGSKYRFNL